MKKIIVVILGTIFIPMLFAAEDTYDANNIEMTPTSQNPNPTNFRPINKISRDILWSQIPNPAVALGLACQLDSVYPFVADCADDVIPTGSGFAVDSVRSWWANWNGFTSWANVPNIQFIVYDDNGGMPQDSPSMYLVVDAANYTATSIGTDQYLVEMELPSQVALNAGVTYWVEVRPANVFTVNGQTGWMGETGIGNGQELYFRFPLLGTQDWVTATSQWGLPYENGFELIGTPLVTQVVWDFETGWQGWTHTNGAAFPAAWTVYDSQYKSGSGFVCPVPDDSSMWIDSDGAGSGAGWIGDTCLSPVLVPLASMDWLWYGWCYNDVGTGDWFEAGIKYFDGASWNVVPLATYTADNSGSYDSVDVSAYAGYSFVQVYFYYDDADSWAWYAAFDNVAIAAQVYVPSDDVGTTDIVAPGTLIMPNTTLDPTATYENFGTDTENFDVYFVIDSSGTNIYNETANITLASGSDTTISFASWTCCGTNGIVYNVMAYTVFGSDINPTNDTLSQTTTVNASFWEILTSIPVGTSGHSESTVHDGVYLVTGFHTTTTYPPTVYEYDIASDTWSLGTDNAFGCGTYGMAYGALGKHYRICGTDTWPTGLTRVDIYDPVADVWSAGAAAPMANMDQIGGVYNDSLIFMFGGGNWGGSVNPHTNVYFYDIYADAWTTATNFPGVGRGCLAGGVVGDYAIVACGYDGSTYRTDYIVGNIDPANPANITWGSPTTIPGGFEGRYRVSSGVDAPASAAQELWVTCGQGTTNPQCSDIWSYEPISDTWTNWNMPKNLAIGNVNSVAITSTALGDIGVYVVGGYTGSYVTDHEVFHTGKVAVEEMPGQQDPSSVFGFAANMKNPTDGYSAITYTTTKPGKVMVKVYDGTGRLVKTLVNRPHEPAGTKTVYWNAKDDESRAVANGIYFVRLEADGKTDTHKMILVK